MSTNDTKIALLEQSIAHISETLLRLEKRIDQRFDRLETKIDKVDNRMWTLTFFNIGAFVGILSLIAKIMHWF